MRYQRVESPALLNGHEAARRFFSSCFRQEDQAAERLWVAHLDQSAQCIQLDRFEGEAASVGLPVRSIMADAVRLGEPANPMLPDASFDRIFLVHMYHEVTEPYEFLWHLRAGLKPGGLIVLVDADRPEKRHGMPPKQALCEFAALGLEPVKLARLADGEAYLAMFKVARERPEPAAIKPCRLKA